MPPSPQPGLHPALPARAEELSREFASSQPFRHLVVEPFLDPSFCQQLIAEFPSFDSRQALNETGEVAGKAVFSNLAELGPAYARFDRLMQDPGFLSLIARITGIPNLLYDPEYIGGGTHENLQGQELDTHVDFNFHPRAQTHRRLNLILFLNPHWQESWGGCLELLRDPWEADCKSVLPLANRAVIFETTESSWHGFRKIQMPPEMNTSRRSLAVYFYTREAPPQGAAPSHATFYYQRPMPSHIKAGYTLQEEDARELETLFARRDQYIRFLYQREMEFSKALSDLTLSRAFRWGTRLAKPLKFLLGKK
jgi:Rps23 Pro-64 3,4-dihydroxylase Tpa1-like proline 4-hydroxylase